MASFIIKNASLLLIVVGLTGCATRGMRPCIPDQPPPEVKEVATADLSGRYKIDSTRSDQLSLFVEKVPTNSLEAHWLYMFMPIDGNTFKKKYGSPKIFRVAILKEQIKRLRASTDTVLQHWDRKENGEQNHGFEFAYPQSDSATHIAFNKTDAGYQATLRLGEENYKWVGDSLAATYRFDDKKEIRKFQNLLERAVPPEDHFSTDSADSKTSQTLSGDC